MDKTKEYIKMCEQAVEIQEKKLKQSADFNSFVWCKRQEGGHELVEGFCCFSAEELSDCCIWLPRQDQLQEIYIKSLGIVVINWSDIICTFNDFCRKYWQWGKNYSEQFSSPEQLWLAFVMKTLYKKEWIKDGWVSV